MTDADDKCDLLAAAWDGVSIRTSPYHWATMTFVGIVLLTFVTSTFSDNYSQVDKLWSILPLVYSWIPVLSLLPVIDSRTFLMACLASIWGIRLTWNFYRRGGYTLWPPWEGDEDYRWAIIRSGGFLKVLKNPFVWTLFNLGFISFYQNLLLLWIAAPSFVVYTIGTLPGCTEDTALNTGDAAIAAFFLMFVLIESIADNQQYAFQTEKYRLKDSGEVLTGTYADGFCQSGLFGIVRKPNYAAEQCIWICFYSFSLTAQRGWFWGNWSGIGVVQLILLFQSSGWFTEKITRSKYPKYADYMKRVPLYVPNIFLAAKSKTP